VLPAQLVGLVAGELGFVRVLVLAVLGRTDSAGPQDVALGYGRSSRRALVGAALLLAVAAGAALLVAPPGLVRWVLVLGLGYPSVATAVISQVGRVRPHLVRSSTLLVRWGLHQDVSVDLRSIRSVREGEPGARQGRDHLVRIPGGRGRTVTVQLADPVAVPTRWGAPRPATHIALPVDDPQSAVAAIATHLVTDPTPDGVQ
jgi:hypothetical protein